MVKTLVIGSAAAALALSGIAAAVVMVRVPTAPPSSGGRMQIKLTTPKPIVLPRGPKLETLPPQSGPMVSTAPITAARPEPPPQVEVEVAEAPPPEDRSDGRGDPGDRAFEEDGPFERRVFEDDRRDWREERERRASERAYEQAEREAEARALRFRDRLELPDLPPPQRPRYERPWD